MDLLAAFRKPKPATTGPYRLATAPDGRYCTHKKKSNDRCLLVGCWNFEPDIVKDAEGRICAHSKSEDDGKCLIIGCWNSRVGNGPAAELFNEMLRKRLIEHADSTIPGWRKEFGTIENLVAAMADYQASHEPGNRPTR